MNKQELMPEDHINHAVGLAQWVHCSPHEWPEGEEVAKVCHALIEVNEQLHILKVAFGMFLNGMSYTETFPEDDDDYKQLQKSATYNFLRARNHVNDELSDQCSMACKAIYTAEYNKENGNG